MGFIVDQPGLSLLITGIVALVVRPFFDWVPLIGGLMSTLLLVAGLFFVVGGIWMFLVGRKPVDP
jgi:hypothetical protein